MALLLRRLLLPLLQPTTADGLAACSGSGSAWSALLAPSSTWMAAAARSRDGGASNSSSVNSSHARCRCAAFSTSAAAAAAAESSTTTSSSTSSPSSSTTTSTSSRRGAIPPLAPPWTPTSQLVKRKTYQKRARALIQALEAEQQASLSAGKQLPAFRSGDILEVTTVVPEAERRAYTYRGLCVARGNKGPRSWLKLYNVFPDAGGWLQHLPIYMPDLLSLRVVGRMPKARRSKLYHVLADESPRHVYQASVGLAQAQPSGGAAAAAGGGRGGAATK